MTAQQLFDMLEQVIHDGHGDAPVYFDTFDYHMAKVGSAGFTVFYEKPVDLIAGTTHENQE